MTVNLSLLGGAGWQFSDNNGVPLSGGLLYTYAAGTTTPQTTYTSISGVTANTNPVVLDAAGRVPSEIWLTDAVSYKFVLKTSASVTIGTYDNVTGNSSGIYAAFAAPTGSSLVGFIQSGTGAVATTVQAKLRESVSVKDFGATGNGTTDDRAAIQAALNASLSVYFPTPSVSYYISDSVTPQGNALVYGDGLSTHIQVPDGTVNCFYVNGTSGVIVRDLKISTKSQTSSMAYKSGVLINNSTNCLVENVFMFNMGYWGVCLYDSSNCIVRNCRFATWFGTSQDSAGIAVYNNSNNNLIDGNYCLASSDHGIFVQDPYSGATPTGNSIVNNHVANAKADGIIVYVTTAYDTQTLISGNRIYDILGTALAGLSGHGIYIQSSGGAIVANNTLTNCCINTTNFETQVVAAIGVATGNTTTYPTGTINEVIVSNNHITAQRGPGIAVQTCGVPVQVDGNIILSTGTTAVRGEAVYCLNADGVQIKNNTIKHVNTNYSAIGVGASALTLNGISVVGNRIRGTTFGIGFDVVGGGAFTNAVITGNIVSGLTSLGLNVANISGAQISNNNLSSTGVVFSLTTCPNTRMTANRFYSNFGSYSIIFTGAAGANAGTIVDESNDLSGVVLNEAANGAIISKYGNAAPASSGYWGVSDRVIQSVSVVGQPKGWRCTVMGNPGTWVSEGNL
jgi:parallel beta-helix repeat protein